MSWLKNSSLGASLGKLRSTNSPSKECDPSACYDSFRKHWQQTNDIIEKTQSPLAPPRTDDVIGVVNHLDHMVTLLLMELRTSLATRPCLDFLLSENLLDKLYKWSLHTGRYGNALRLEQLRLYEILVSHSRTQLLIHEPFHRPLQALLESCAGECFSVEVEKRLVVLLNQLCVSLVQHNQLLHLFFQEAQDDKPAKFIIFSLLIPFVHREGALGQQARDALLLCMVLSKNNQAVAEYIAHQSTVCPVLATGLSGLYSLLPRKLTIEAEDWHRFTPDDVNELPELAAFMNSLEFCNAVVQVAHPLIRAQLLEFLYRGFLVPVMGPALLQSTEEELTAATAYFDLFIRSLTEPGLLHSFISFIIQKTYDGQRIIDSLIQRIKAKSRLCLVTLALFETLVDLNCEDIMLELVLCHLVPCTHVMLSQRTRVKHVDPYCRSAEKFLSLAPNINSRTDHAEGSLYGDYQAYLHDARSKIMACSVATESWVYAYDGENPPHTGLAPRPEVTACVESEVNDHSLPSADDGSSGYESFAFNKENGRGSESGGECESPCGSSGEGGDTEVCASGSGDVNRNYSPNKTQSSLLPLRKSLSLYMNMNVFNTTPFIGPFLDVLFSKLEGMLSHDLYVNLRLTGLVSRLAIYPQPLLHSFLLDHSLVFQPSIRSLFQVLGSLKHRIEAVLNQETQVNSLVNEAQRFLLEREDRLVNARKHALEAPASLPPPTTVPLHTSNDPFDRSDSKRRSLSLALSSVFRRHQTSNQQSGSVSNSSAPVYRFLRKGGGEEVRNVVMCAVILDEWLKELAAITQEHAILRT